MIPKEIIKLAIKGGLKHPEIVNYVDAEMCMTVLSSDFWKSLAKELCWEHQNTRFCRLIKPYYSGKTDFNKLYGTIIGESRDKKEWRVRWDNRTTVYNYPKEYIADEQGKDWKEHAHNFFDILLTGGNTEKFWKDLLAD